MLGRRNNHCAAGGGHRSEVGDRYDASLPPNSPECDYEEVSRYQELDCDNKLIEERCHERKRVPLFSTPLRSPPLGQYAVARSANSGHFTHNAPD